MTFKQAVRSQKKLRFGGDGPPGSGKTYTMLRFGHVIADAIGKSKKVAVIDSENGSASCFVGENPDGIKFDFAIETLTDYSPVTYTTKIKEAGASGFDVLIIDSLSHAWAGEGGTLDLHTDATQKGESGGNSYYAWRKVTPLHNAMIEAILRSPCHVLATLRTKIEYVEVKNPSTGKTTYERVGAKPIQREGCEYEFDIFGDFHQDEVTNAQLVISKSRCVKLERGAKAVKAGRDFILPVVEWLREGAPVKDEAPALTAFDRFAQRLLACKTREELGVIGREVKAAEDQLKSSEIAWLKSQAEEMKAELPSGAVSVPVTPPPSTTTPGTQSETAKREPAPAPAVNPAPAPPVATANGHAPDAPPAPAVEGESLKFTLLRKRIEAAKTTYELGEIGREASALKGELGTEFDKLVALGKRRKEWIAALAAGKTPPA
jgi:hypothetical protein